MHESKYMLETPVSYRKDYGQFFTPVSVARLMSDWVMKDGARTVLDPAFGLGVFYEEIRNINPHTKVQFIGYEIDKHILSYLKLNGSETNLRIINDDYFEADLSKYDAIICNPPYMRFQKFLTRHDVLPKIEKKIGKRLVGYSNTSSVFLVKALKELNSHGRLAFIMPFEFFNTGYGKKIKKSLLEEHLLKQIIIFSNEKEIFPDATTTVCILLCKNDGVEDSIKITLIDNKEQIDTIDDISEFYQRKIISSDLPYNKKWSPIIFPLSSEITIPDGFCQLNQYGMFKRGIATGANEFFALKKSKIEELHLSKNNICKCITKSSHIKKTVFNEGDFFALYNADKPVHCLDVKDHKDQSTKKYIKLGEQQGMHKRYLTKIRKPWYKIERRQPAPFLFGVFSRGRLKVVRNYSTAINFTCYHSFYPNIFGQRYINKLFVYFLSDMGQSIIKMNKRSYGDNLDKLEPGDLNECLCPNQEKFALIEDPEAEEVIETAKSNEELAIQMSNELINRTIKSQQCVLPECYSSAFHSGC